MTKRIAAAIFGAVISLGLVTPTAAQAEIAHPQKLMVIVEHGHFGQARKHMTYLWSLAQRYAYASDYHAVAGTYLPNRLAIIGGSTYGINDDKSPASHYVEALSALDQSVYRWHTAKVYAESMPSNCAMTNSAPYAVNRNPWAYYWTRTNCGDFDIPANDWTGDAQSNSLPNVGMLIPDRHHDGSSSPLRSGKLHDADTWLRTVLPPMLASSDFTSGNLAAVVVFDNGSATNQHVLAVVLDSNLHSQIVTTPLDHYSLSRWLSDTVNAPPLNDAATATDMRAEFGL